MKRRSTSINMRKKQKQLKSQSGQGLTIEDQQWNIYSDKQKEAWNSYYAAKATKAPTDYKNALDSLDTAILHLNTLRDSSKEYHQKRKLALTLFNEAAGSTEKLTETTEAGASTSPGSG